MRLSIVTTTLALLVICGCATAPPRAADDPGVVPYGAQLEGFAYPFLLQRFEFDSQGQHLSMAFMDVAPLGVANGRTVVLLHGKNFCGATWESQIVALTQAGYRVIAPDQIGFCASSKPVHYQYSFEQLAANTRALLASRDVKRVTVVGHSMGGMLATRLALEWPDDLDRLVLVDPLGLEDWRALGVPPASVDSLIATELKTGYASIRAYEARYYYPGGEWKPEYDRWVRMLAGAYAGPGRERMALASALASDMIYTQPVVHEFERLRVPTTLFIGLLDRTAPGANRASPELQSKLGDYPTLGRDAARRIPGATLVEFDGVGHAPQVQAPERFNAALLRTLGTP